MILIGLGANRPSDIGAPLQTLRAALEQLRVHNVRVLQVSRFFQSEAWPDPTDPPFVNAVASIETAMAPAMLLRHLHAIEAKFGRERSARNAPRTLDLDIIDFDGRIEAPVDGEGPVLPHPRAHERAFVLAPLLDVAPDWVHPASRLAGSALLAAAQAAGNHAIPLILQP